MIATKTREVNDQYGNPICDVHLMEKRVTVEVYPENGRKRILSTTEHDTEEAALAAFAETCEQHNRAGVKRYRNV